MSRLLAASDSHYDACGSIAGGAVSAKNAAQKENCMSGNVTEVLAGFAASLQYDDLPAEVRDHCKNLLLDTLACAVAGHRGEETQQLAALAAGLAQSDQSSVIGGGPPAPSRAAPLQGCLRNAGTQRGRHPPQAVPLDPGMTAPR